MTVTIKPFDGTELEVTGEYKEAEPEVGLNESFDFSRITSEDKNLLNIIEWAASRGKYGDILQQIEDLCLEQIHDK